MLSWMPMNEAVSTVVGFLIYLLLMIGIAYFANFICLKIGFTSDYRWYVVFIVSVMGALGCIFLFVKHYFLKDK